MYTIKKSGYGYNPIWLLAIVHGYAYNPMAIVHCAWAIGLGY
jgi:hypothetical protein